MTWKSLVNLNELLVGMEKNRCKWVNDNPLMINYHDKEWGVPAHRDRYLFEKLMLDCNQAGLSWEIILNKRQGYKNAYSNFDFNKIAKYTERDVKRLLKDSGIVRNQLKIRAAISNAKGLIEIRKEFKTFDKYIWQFVDGVTITNKWKKLKDIPSQTEESILMSKDLKKRGFKFVGPTVCYAFMQAIGMVNDHTPDCFRYKQLK